MIFKRKKRIKAMEENNCIKNQIAQQLPFVLYCKPNSTVDGFLQKK
jgi:hypothetical protein